jgi:pyruvate/2-oxoglutarate/acetoin dehydrogenase E1 component
MAEINQQTWPQLVSPLVRIVQNQSPYMEKIMLSEKAMAQDPNQVERKIKRRVEAVANDGEYYEGSWSLQD